HAAPLNGVPGRRRAIAPARDDGSFLSVTRARRSGRGFFGLGVGRLADGGAELRGDVGPELLLDPPALLAVVERVARAEALLRLGREPVADLEELLTVDVDRRLILAKRLHQVVGEGD